MTPTKPSQLLKAALEHLWDGTYPCPKSKERFICHAVYKVWEVSNVDCSVSDAAKRLIVSRLEPHDSVETWLYFSRRTRSTYRALVGESGLRHLYRGEIPEMYSAGPQNERYFKQIQAYRKRWVEHLIKELRTKGK